MGTCGLYLGRREVGELAWHGQNGRLTAVCSCPFEAGMIYRVVLQTDRGVHRLGVMLPEDQRFTLRRELPAGMLPQSAHVDRTMPGEAHLPGLPLAFSAFSKDEEEEEALECTVKGQLLRGDWMDARFLLFPLPLGGQCCAPQLLCIATLLELEGRPYGLVCRRDRRYLPLSDMVRRGDVLW